MFQCELHHLDGNERLWRDWRDLLNRVRPELRLFGPEWFSIWNQTIGSRQPWTGSMHVAAVYDEEDGRLCGVLPVGHPKVGLLKVNALGGYYQPWRLILADQACEYQVGRALGWFLVELGWSVIQLGPWPQSHDAHQGVLSALDELDIHIRRKSSYGLAVAEVPPTWSQYQEQVVGRKFLRRIGNYERKLRRQHQIEVRHYRQPSETETREMLSALSHVEKRSWLAEDSKGRPRFLAAADQQFWTTLTREVFAPHDRLDCWLMLADGQPVSFVFSLDVLPTRYVIANSYDEAFTQYRTGSILYRHLFEDGYQRGVTRYDFGTNELHYKRQWGAQYLDGVNTYTVATNRLVNGFFKAGVKLKSLWDSSPWGYSPTTELFPSPDPVSSRSSAAPELDTATVSSARRHLPLNALTEKPVTR